MTTFTSTDEIKAGVKVGDSVTLVARAAEFDVKKNTVIILDGTYDIGEGQRWQWHTKGSKADPLPVAPPPATPVPLPATGVEKLLASSNLFAKNAQTVIGVADTGTLGSTVDAPEGYGGLVDGYRRRALLSGGIDPIVIGIGADAFMLGYRDDAGRHSIVQGAFINFRGIPGSFNSDGVWRGSQGRLDLTQTFALGDGSVTIAMDLFNPSNQPINDVTVTRMVDADDRNAIGADAFATQNVVTAIGTVEAQLLGANKGRKVVLSSQHPNARASVYGSYGATKFDPFAPELLAGKIGVSSKADKNINVTVPVGTILPGQMARVEFTVVLL